MKKKLKFTFLVVGILYLFSLILLYIDSILNVAKFAEVAVVFGNKVKENGQPSERLLELYSSHKVKKIIVSGGTGKEGFDEAVVMAGYLKHSGVIESDIFIDSNGYNTFRTSLYVKSKVNKNTCVVAVTQQYHISRAKLSLRNAGFSCVYGYYPSYFELRDIYAWSREIPAWLKYWIFKE